MCGIVGFINAGLSESHIDMMLQTIVHRGPDDVGSCQVSTALGNGFFGHRRLSIIDLSMRGHQPMKRGKWTIVYNGEIYNAPELRRELEAAGHSFYSDCDTEILLAAVEQWGVGASLKRFNGMFAFALTDGHDLFLARDRWGKKPLFYYYDGKELAFASELQALRALPTPCCSELDSSAIDQYFIFGFIPTPQTPYRNCQQVFPGEFIHFSEKGVKRERYWRVDYTQSGKFAGSEADALAELDSLLTSAVTRRMMADVPLGCFLSGGIDSSLISAIACKVKGEPLKTFTIGFDSAACDESVFAERIAGYLKTQHTTRILAQSELLPLLPELPKMFAAPFSDPSAFPTALVAKVAREQVTVAVSGDGGDEHFGGYPHYGHDWVYQLALSMPSQFRCGTALLLQRMLKGTRFYKYAKNLNFKNRADALLFYRNYALPDFEKLTGRRPEIDDSEFFRCYQEIVNSHPDDTGLIWPALDQKFYMVDDILVKADRTSMRYSLEVRAPFLDYELTDFANTLPYRMKVNGKNQKYLLKKLLAKYIPPELWDRPKQGFSLPLASWLRKELRDSFMAMLDKNEGNPYYDTNYVRKNYNRFLQGDPAIRKIELWSIFAFELWRESLSEGKQR